MADQATYVLMASYIVLFAILFVCVLGAIILLVREETAGERARAAATARHAVAPSPKTMTAPVVRGVAPATSTPPTLPHPA